MVNCAVQTVSLGNLIVNEICVRKISDYWKRKISTPIINSTVNIESNDVDDNEPTEKSTIARRLRSKSKCSNLSALEIGHVFVSEFYEPRLLEDALISPDKSQWKSAMNK